MLLVEDRDDDDRDAARSRRRLAAGSSTSQPSTPGRRMSSTTAAGDRARISSSPSRPSRASTTCTPSPSRYAVIRSSEARSSSTTTTMGRSVAASGVRVAVSTARADRHGEAERAAHAQLGLQPHRPAEQRDDPTAQGQPETRPLLALRAAATLLERLEDPLTVFRGNADPVVGDRHREVGRRVVGPTTDDTAAVGRELHRVAEQVQQHLLEPELVGVEGVDARLDLERELDAVGRRPLAHHRDAVLERAPAAEKVERSSSIRPASTFDRSRMSLSSCSRCLPELRMSRRYSSCRSFSSPNSRSSKHLGEADHGVERRPQLVRHAREELGLVLADDLQLGGLRLELAEQLGVPDGERRLAREGLEELDRLAPRIRRASCAARRARR